MVSEKDLSDYFEQVANLSKDPKVSANWVRGEVLNLLKEQGLSITDEKMIAAKDLAQLIQFIAEGLISGKMAKGLFLEMFQTKKSPQTLVDEKGLKQVTDESQITAVVKKVLDGNQGQVEQYLSGKDKVFGFFVGQVMKETKGAANPSQVNQLLKKLLGERKK